MVGKFKLDIYTWPVMQGVNPQVRTTQHETPKEAISHLEAQVDAYAYASLQRPTMGGHTSCDWNGQPIVTGEKWPLRHGTNGQHPAVIALKDDWENLVRKIREVYQERGVAMVDIADDLLKTRHPQTNGWVHNLAWMAAAP